MGGIGLWPGPQAVWHDRSRAHLLGALPAALADVVASPATTPWGLGRRPGGGPEGEESRAGALHDNDKQDASVNLVVSFSC